MKLGLVAINRDIFSQYVAPLGLCFIASYLKKEGAFGGTSVIDKNTQNIYETVLKTKPDLLGISAVTQSMEEAKKFAAFAKSHLGIPVILGGVHPSISPSSLPEDADVGVIGEGEDTMLELMPDLKEQK